MTLDESLLKVDDNVAGSATGYLRFKVPGKSAFIDTYIVVKNESYIDQGYFNSTLKWSSESSWDKTGDIYMFVDLSNIASTPVRSIKIRETLSYGDNNYKISSYFYKEHTEYLNAYGSGQYMITNGYDW